MYCILGCNTSLFPLSKSYFRLNILRSKQLIFTRMWLRLNQQITKKKNDFIVICILVGSVSIFSLRDDYLIRRWILSTAIFATGNKHLAVF